MMREMGLPVVTLTGEPVTVATDGTGVITLRIGDNNIRLASTAAAYLAGALGIAAGVDVQTTQPGEPVVSTLPYDEVAESRPCVVCDRLIDPGQSYVPGEDGPTHVKCRHPWPGFKQDQS
jgi:hypothetical protein